MKQQNGNGKEKQKNGYGQMGWDRGKLINNHKHPYAEQPKAGPKPTRQKGGSSKTLKPFWIQPEGDQAVRRSLADFKIWNKQLIGKGKASIHMKSTLLISPLGSYADVKLARDTISKRKVALKIYEKNRLHT